MRAALHTEGHQIGSLWLVKRICVSDLASACVQKRTAQISFDSHIYHLKSMQAEWIRVLPGKPAVLQDQAAVVSSILAAAGS